MGWRIRWEIFRPMQCSFLRRLLVVIVDKPKSPIPTFSQCKRRRSTLLQLIIAVCGTMHRIAAYFAPIMAFSLTVRCGIGHEIDPELHGVKGRLKRVTQDSEYKARHYPPRELSSTNLNTSPTLNNSTHLDLLTQPLQSHFISSS